MSLDYMTPGARRPWRKFPWRGLAIAVFTLFAVFVLFCSGLSLPILGGASREFRARLQDEFGLALPASAVVEKGARVAQLDQAYCFVVRVAPADMQPFIDSIRLKGLASLQHHAEFVILAPQPPAWFDPKAAPDLITFDVHKNWIWRWGYSPSTGKIYVLRMSF